MEELEYMESVYKLTKKELRFKVMSQNEQITELRTEISTMKFVLADASEDYMNVPLAQKLIRENKQANSLL
tara:strand:+ start:1973 stop:2185 length:213 start_codon:yes stop_codon:yes gene_type:complete